jgi:hypothetical protein
MDIKKDQGGVSPPPLFFGGLLYITNLGVSFLCLSQPLMVEEKRFEMSQTMEWN